MSKQEKVTTVSTSIVNLSKMRLAKKQEAQIGVISYVSACFFSSRLAVIGKLSTGELFQHRLNYASEIVSDTFGSSYVEALFAVTVNSIFAGRRKLSLTTVLLSILMYAQPSYAISSASANDGYCESSFSLLGSEDENRRALFWWLIVLGGASIIGLIIFGSILVAARPKKTSMEKKIEYCKFHNVPMGKGKWNRSMNGLLLNGVVGNVIAPAELGEAEEVVVVAANAPQPNIPQGLRYQPITGDGHCLYRSVAYYLGHGEDVSYLRSIVATNLEHNAAQYAGFISLRDGQSIQDYIEEVRSTSMFAGNVEIDILMKLLDRPIVVIGPDGTIRNKDAVNQYTGKEPIFVFYNGGDERGSSKPGHYDVLLLHDGYNGRDILSEMLVLPEGAPVVHIDNYEDCREVGGQEMEIELVQQLIFEEGGPSGIYSMKGCGKSEHERTFCSYLSNKLCNFIIGNFLVDSGIVAPTRGTISRIATGVECTGDVFGVAIPVIGKIIQLFLKWLIAKPMEMIDNKEKVESAKKISELFRDNYTCLELMVGKIASKLASCYEPQINMLLEKESVRKFAEFCFVLIELISKHDVMLDENRSLVDQLVNFIITTSIADSFPDPGKEEVFTVDGKRWRIGEICTKCGVKDRDGRCFSSDRTDTSMYGFCNGSEEIAVARGLTVENQSVIGVVVVAEIVPDGNDADIDSDGPVCCHSSKKDRLLIESEDQTAGTSAAHLRCGSSGLVQPQPIEVEDQTAGTSVAHSMRDVDCLVLPLELENRAVLPLVHRSMGFFGRVARAVGLQQQQSTVPLLPQ